MDMWSELTRRRLYNLRLAGPRFEKVSEVVRWLVAVQSQDYYPAQWMLALRMHSAREEDIERAYNDGEILRTHVMRPTWHFVTPDDIRWLLELTAPRVIMREAPYLRRLGVDEAVLKRSNDAIAHALEGGNHLTRQELKPFIESAGVAVKDNQMLNHLMMRAEVDRVVCSGPRRGKQFTYALFDEHAPSSRSLPPDEALAELTRRYFTSRGPATEYDFSNWSGLTVTDARRGLEMLGSELVCEEIDGRKYWYAPADAPAPADSPRAFLLSVFDEYLCSYRDRRAMLAEEHVDRLLDRGNAALAAVIVIDGQIVGAWKRKLKRRSVTLSFDFFQPLTAAERQAVEAEAAAYGEFLGLPVEMDLPAS